jgi:phage repressor protein C with HTH and peptisase S24 domain
VVGEDTGKKKLVKKLQMQHIQTLQLKQKNVTKIKTEHIIQQLSV